MLENDILLSKNAHEKTWGKIHWNMKILLNRIRWKSNSIHEFSKMTPQIHWDWVAIGHMSHWPSAILCNAYWAEPWISVLIIFPLKICTMNCVASTFSEAENSSINKKRKWHTHTRNKGSVMLSKFRHTFFFVHQVCRQK